MKKWRVPIILASIFLIFSFFIYNSLVDKQETASTAWSNVESTYQRRADLIDNLVSTVKGAADFERTTLTEVIEARANATKVNIDASNLTPEAIANFQQAQSGLTGALSRLLVTVERYPELKANQNFLNLQSQLEGTENRIEVARNRFNEAVDDYEKYRKKLPGKLYASTLGFEAKHRFASDPGSEKAPDVDFDFE